MRKILIIGANSYIGTSFEEYILNSKVKYIVDTVDVIDGSWRERSFTGYDTIIHVAGIAHIKESEDNKDLYYKVNYELAVEVASKAKAEGIKQFIFLSSMSVYGMDIGIITKKTYPNPVTNYGKSKLMAENDIRKIEDAEFKVAVVRPPMIYGEGCKGNYNALIKFAEKMPIFPNVDNRRSMLRIDIVYLSVPKIFQKILDAIGMVIGILFYGYAFKASLTAVEEAFRGGSSSPAMQIPMYIIYMSAAIGFGLAILRQIQIIVMTLWGASHRQEEQTNCKGGDEEC